MYCCRRLCFVCRFRCLTIFIYFSSQRSFHPSFPHSLVDALNNNLHIGGISDQLSMTPSGHHGRSTFWDDDSTSGANHIQGYVPTTTNASAATASSTASATTANGSSGPHAGGGNYATDLFFMQLQLLQQLPRPRPQHLLPEQRRLIELNIRQLQAILNGSAQATPAQASAAATAFTRTGQFALQAPQRPPQPQPQPQLQPRTDTIPGHLQGHHADLSEAERLILYAGQTANDSVADQCWG